MAEKEYLKWNTKTITDFSPENITNLYNQGFVLTRKGKGQIDQTRSLRIELSKFEMSSENRRVLRKTEEIKLKEIQLPYSDYDWQIGKLAKDFYDKKFGPKTFSANKTKELLTSDQSNFNLLLTYIIQEETMGYSISYQNSDILHYSYPFYDLNSPNKNIGMGMMLRAINHAKESNKKYIYLGSAQRPTDTYKFQFKGLEWFDGENWGDDFDELKTILNKI